MLNNKNYITVQGWMIKELNLKGNELLAYALIYGFSQDNESVFSGTNTYVAEWLNTTKKTAINVLKDLVQKEYIIKTEKKVNGVTFYDYKINTQVVKNFHGGSEKITPNNNIYNNIPPLNNNNKLLLLSPQGEKKPYGESQFVFLTDTEYAKVKELYGEFLDDAINTLDSYIASNPKKLAKKYSSHFAVLRKNNWVYKEIFGKRKQPLASNVTEDELNSFVDMWNTMVNRLAPRGEFINGNKVRSIVADNVKLMLPDAKRNLLCMINEIKNWDKLPLAINVPLDEENYWNWALVVVANRLLRSSYLRGQAPNAPMFTFDVKFFCYNIKKLANPYDECYLDR